MKLFPVVLNALAALPQANAFFKVICSGNLIRDRMDPIVSPNGVSSHLHTVSGGSAFDASLTYDRAIKSDCTSCNVKQDKSNYWTPDLWVRAKNGSFHPVGHGGHTVYYLQRRHTAGEVIYPFPKDFVMLAGNPMLRSYTPTLAQRAVGFACFYTGRERTPGLPSYKCPGGVRADMTFPSCWDGKRVDSPDHKSHMAYPSGVDVGKCPPTHPKRLPTLFFETLYDTAKWDSEWVGDKHPFVFSNGDPYGYSYHGDFVNGWDIPVLAESLTKCDKGKETVEECPVLTILSSQERERCRVSPRVNEDTDGWLSKLPGCNPVQYGPRNAVMPPNCGAPLALSPPKTYASDMSDHGWSYRGCAVDQLGDRLFPFQRRATADMTIQQCITHCSGHGYKLAGLEYANECYCGSEISEDKIVANPNCHMKCIGDAKQFCGGPQRLSVYQKGKPANNQ